MIMDDSTSMTYLLVVAKSALNDLLPGEEFIVEDLFRPFEWKRLDLEIHEDLERLFFDYADNEGASIIEVLGETDSLQQLYRKR